MRRSLRAAAGIAAMSFAVTTCGGDSPTTPAPVCTIAISPSSADYGAGGGTGSVSVNTGPGCAWSASAAASWITITGGASGSGSGTVTYSLAANSSTEIRNGTLSVGGQAVTVRQQGRSPVSCTYELSHPLADYGPGGGSGSFTITTAGECRWSAASDSLWVTIDSGAQGSGNGTVTYAVGSNTAASGRDAMISVADRSFEVRQAGNVTQCEYSLTPVQFDACMPAGTVQATLTTQASCPWTATPDASWITLPGGGSGSGPAVISLTFSENYDAPRNGLVMVRWPTPTAGQNIRVAQAGCTYGVSPSAFTVTSAGTSSSFNVVQQSLPVTCGGATQDRCVWTAVSSVPWITITSSMPKSGDNPVAFTVQANGAPQPRTGQIRVRDQIVTVTQAGQ